MANRSSACGTEKSPKRPVGPAALSGPGDEDTDCHVGPAGLLAMTRQGDCSLSRWAKNRRSACRPSQSPSVTALPEGEPGFFDRQKRRYRTIPALFCGAGWFPGGRRPRRAASTRHPRKKGTRNLAVPRPWGTLSLNIPGPSAPAGSGAGRRSRRAPSAAEATGPAGRWSPG